MTLLPCKLDHSDPEVIPQCLCVRCHPERVHTPEEDAAFYAEIKAKQQAEDAERKLQRDIEKTRRDLDRLMLREPEEGSVSHKIMLSLQTKLAKLEGLI